MEKYHGSKINNEYTCLPAYTVSELGQLSLNASIAEKLGFTIDADPWHRQAQVLYADGNVKTEVVLVRKCAYFFPKEIRNLIKRDGDLVAKGYAMQKLKNKSNEDNGFIDIRTGRDGDYIISEIQETITSEPNTGKKICCYAAHSEKTDKCKFGVSHKSAVSSGINHKNQIEEYEFLDDAINSEFFNNLSLMNQQILTFYSSKNE